MESKKIDILDTTLRDGQQAPDAGMSYENNIKYAQKTTKLGVDIIEAGFPTASKSQWNIVNEIVNNLSDQENAPKVAGLTQLKEKMIEETIKALQPGINYGKSRIHIYLPIDPNLTYSIKNYDKYLKDIERLTNLAKKSGIEVQFSLEGFSKIEDFLLAEYMISSAIEGGATIINCPDTIGGDDPILDWENHFVHKMNYLKEIIDNSYKNNNIIWSVHCHNDYGTAADNSIIATTKGPATQIEGTINGVGERAGNTAIEQLAIRIQEKGKNLGIYTNIETEQLSEISGFVSENMMYRAKNHPITGENASRHTSGGHTNVITQNPLAYQPFEPEKVGKEVKLSFSHSSGGALLKDILQRNNKWDTSIEGYQNEIAQFVKEKYSHHTKTISDQEVIKAFLKWKENKKS